WLLLEQLVLDDADTHRRGPHNGAELLQRLEHSPVDELVLERDDRGELRESFERGQVVPTLLENDTRRGEPRRGRVREPFGDDDVHPQPTGRLEGHPSKLPAAQDA